MATAVEPLEGAKPPVGAWWQKPRHAWRTSILAFDLAIIWVEAWAIPLLAWWLLANNRYVILALLLAGVARSRRRYRHELAGNITETYTLLVRYRWQRAAKDNAGHPTLEHLTLTDPAPPRKAIKGLLATRGRWLPFEEAVFVIRRPDDKGAAGSKDSWRAQFEETLRRRYRFESSDSQTDPTDPNRDIITLSSDDMPDVYEAI